MQIISLTSDNDEAIDHIADMLVEAFKENWPKAWPTYEAATKEVWDSLGAGRVSRIAVGDNGEVLGWIGAIREYEGHTWELHPLVVKPGHQGQGIGRALVADLEDQLRQRGVITIYLGTDDENGMTSLAGINLLPDVWEHIARIQNLKGHPYEFYQKVGFTIIGVIPDANGPGKSDILMAKSLVNN